MLLTMARQRRVSIPLNELTDRQVHLHLIGLYEELVSTLKSMEHQMADLNQSVADLEQAVDSINARFAGQLLSLKEALDAANQALADEELDDEATQQALTEALAQAESAANQINSQVQELNAIGNEPDTPVEPDPSPVDETPIEPPAEEV